MFSAGCCQAWGEVSTHCEGEETHCLVQYSYGTCGADDMFAEEKNYVVVKREFTALALKQFTQEPVTNIQHLLPLFEQEVRFPSDVRLSFIKVCAPMLMELAQFGCPSAWPPHRSSRWIPSRYRSSSTPSSGHLALTGATQPRIRCAATNCQ